MHPVGTVLQFCTVPCTSALWPILWPVLQFCTVFSNLETAGLAANGYKAFKYLPYGPIDEVLLLPSTLLCT